VYKNISLI